MVDFLAPTKLLEDDLVAWRRDFHRYPEIAFQEVRTAGKVAAHLASLGIEARTGVAETGVVGMIEGVRPGPTVLLRFDMDALPIDEQTGAEYSSLNPGVMHACGHDGHTAIGMAVAKMIHDRRAEMAGSVKLVFQPAEEALGGAERMVQEGVLEDPRPDYSLALHLWNTKPQGWIGVTSGPAMAGSELLEIQLEGVGGHGAAPHLTADPILAAAQVITSLQSVVSRNVNPSHEAVVSITWIEAGQAFNIIPERVVMRGTVRTFDPQVRSLVIGRIKEIVEGVAGAMGCKAEIHLQEFTPPVRNDPALAEKIQSLARRLYPEARIVHDERTMGSEDFAFFSRDIPGCFIFIGSQNTERGLDAPHHNPRFDFDEEALGRGAALIAAAAWMLLEAE